MQVELEIGAVGWDHPAWTDAFYPETLPEDWRLMYYGNEFRRCLVPETQWKDLSPAIAEDWVDEVRADFRFYIEVSFGNSSGAAALAQTLSTHMGGFVVRAGQCSDAQLEELAELAHHWPVHLDVAGELKEALGDNLAGCGIGLCWRSGLQAVQSASIGFIGPRESALGLRDLRVQIQSFIGQSEGGELVLFFEGEPPSVQAMRDAAVIAGLLGA